MSYKVTVHPSGHVFELAENETVLDGALRHGIMLPYSCRGGSCGTCLGDVLSGEISFPDGLPLGLMESDRAQGQALFCCAVAKTDLQLDVREVRSRAEIRTKTLPAQVQSLRRLAPDVMEVRLALPASEPLNYRAGQYVDFLLGSHQRRSFSIANAPATRRATANDNSLTLYIRLVPTGELTERVFNTFQVNTLVRIEAPLGDFYVREESNRPLLMMAGGTGFAPIKAMIEQLHNEQDTRPIRLYWGARTPQDLYHHALATSWVNPRAFDYTPVLSAIEADDDWPGRRGWVHDAAADDVATSATRLADFDVYVAGPPQMIVAARTRFLGEGLPPEQLFCDAFEYSND